MKRILEHVLKLITRAILRRYKPRVVAIVGSVGKTSAKEAIYTAISKAFEVRKSEESYNNELGVPLTVIGAHAQGKNLVGWLYVFLKGLWLMTGITRYPSVLVIEFGEQRPGDIEYLSKLVNPEIVVLTAIEKVHLEFFKSLEVIAKELSTAVTLLPETGKAVVNQDDVEVEKLVPSISASVTTVGMSEDSDIRADQVHVTEVEGTLGLSVKVLYRDTAVPIFLPGIVAKTQAYSVLEACGVGLHLGMNLVDIGNALSSYVPPKGRTNLINGINESLIIDDSYNSSPTAAIAALRIFNDLPVKKGEKKIAVFGDILELGEYTEQGHREVGEVCYKADINKLITVGTLAKHIASGAQAAGMTEHNIYVFEKQDEAVMQLKKLISTNDIILIKGSQGARMERVVKAVMAHPEKAMQLLVRQSNRWQHIL